MTDPIVKLKTNDSLTEYLNNDFEIYKWMKYFF